MPKEQISSLQNELRQFVLQTQIRLNALQESLKTLKQIERTPAPEEPRYQANEVEIYEEAKEEGLTPDRPEPTTVSLPKPDLKRPEGDATAFAAGDSSGAVDRLEAIKRRLAEQMENK